jgi:hypothetical protein
MATIHVSESTAAALSEQAAASGLALDAYLEQLARSAGGLDESYIREGLELAREQIRRGESSNTPIAEVIAKAQQRRASRT